MNSANKLRVYAAGGFGINIGTKIKARAEICYLDTSMANRTDGIDPSKCYLIDGLNGAGQDRRKVYAAVLPHIPKIVEHYAPADFNIVIFSSSGGSGSVIGPLLVRELLKANQTVVVLTVGETDTAKFLDNTINTLKSLESISASLRKPIAMTYFENSRGIPLREIDDEVLFSVEALEEVSNQQNSDLDLSDVHNWINYNNVCGVRPQLSALAIYDNRHGANSALEPISTISLYTDREDYAVVGNPHFSKAGYPREPLVKPFEQLHFVINTISVDEIMKSLTERTVEQAQRFSSYRNRKSLVNIQDDNVTGEDMVL